VEIFLDSADINEIQKWTDLGVIDGVTTNPSIMLKDGVCDTENRIKEIANLVFPCPVFTQVTTDNISEMLLQAHHFNMLAENIVVKIPQINQNGVPCYGVMRQLENCGVKVNATATLSVAQLMMAAKAGVSYISVFAGRISDEGGDANKVISDSTLWLKRWEYKSKVIVGSIRSVGDAVSAALAGAHVVTIPPIILTKMADHRYTRETVRHFIADAEKTAEMFCRG